MNTIISSSSSTSNLPTGLVVVVHKRELEDGDDTDINVVEKSDVSASSSSSSCSSSTSGAIMVVGLMNRRKVCTAHNDDDDDEDTNDNNNHKFYDTKKKKYRSINNGTTVQTIQVDDIESDQYYEKKHNQPSTTTTKNSTTIYYYRRSLHVWKTCCYRPSNGKHYNRIMNHVNILFTIFLAIAILVVGIVMFRTSSTITASTTPTTPIQGQFQRYSQNHERQQQQHIHEPYKKPSQKFLHDFVLDSDEHNVTRIWNYSSSQQDALSSFNPLFANLEASASTKYSKEEHKGVYRFVSSRMCNPRNTHSIDTKHLNANNHECYIHFPTSCTPTSCLVTLRGSKQIQKIFADDDQVDLENESLETMPNQDRIVLLTSSQNSLLSTSKYNGERGHFWDQSWFVAGLFDGHGDYGHRSSHVASIDLPIRLLQNLHQEKHHASLKNNKDLLASVADLAEATFAAVDEHDSIKSIPNSGTTAITVWKQGSIVYIASAGDSTAYVVQWKGYGSMPINNEDSTPGTTTRHTNNVGIGRATLSTAAADVSNSTQLYQILATAVKHKPGDPVERRRIESNGGTVYIPVNPQESSRVLFFAPVTIETRVGGITSKKKGSQSDRMKSSTAHTNGIGMNTANGGIDDITNTKNNHDTVMMQMGIAMSRSLGDQEAKDLNLMISKPSVVSVDLKDFTTAIASTTGTSNTSGKTSLASARPTTRDRFFVILATDGLFDVLNAHNVVVSVGTALYGTDNDYDRVISVDNDTGSSTSAATSAKLARKNQKDQANTYSRSGSNTPTSLLRSTCETLLEEAKSRWSIETQNTYRDDISLLVKAIDLE